MKADLSEKISIPDGVSVSYTGTTLAVKGPKGEVSREFFDQRVRLKVEGNEVVIECKAGTKRESKTIFTLRSHLRNMLKGVQEHWKYDLLVCSSHFPMNVKLSNGVLKVKNFLGEKTERVCTVPDDVKVNVNGANITVSSADIERAGNVASSIELTTRISNRDLRVFQDGIYITKKAKKQ